jgi:hypothetical protein
MGCVLAVLALPAGASGEVYDGLMQFGNITDPSGPEDFSWEVELGPEQELQAIDDQEAAVFYTDLEHTRAFTIEAVAAHDAIGTSVPTTLAVVGPNTITLTVHHQEGNPLAGGAPFDYPITAGAGWEGGFVQVELKGPPGESDQGRSKELHLNCLVGHGLAAKAHPRHCFLMGRAANADWLLRLARLRWSDWGEPVAHAAGLALDWGRHTGKRLEAIAFGSAECDGVGYYKRLRFRIAKARPITINIAPLPTSTACAAS